MQIVVDTLSSNHPTSQSTALVEGEIAKFMTDRNLYEGDVHLCPMRELMQRFPNKLSATTLPSGRAIAVVRDGPRTFYAVEEQTKPRSELIQAPWWKKVFN